ncbi:hypothetical protein I3679_020125 [Proteus mirabilis]|uniref:Uncharacterized protein n=1 Tax=Proteus mirabilis TaxID=584 RepID=A0ABD5LV58_PROMI
MSIRQLSRLTHRLGILLTLSVMLMISPMTQATETQAGWQQFKARYITPEGVSLTVLIKIFHTQKVKDMAC